MRKSFIFVGIRLTIDRVQVVGVGVPNLLHLKKHLHAPVCSWKWQDPQYLLCYDAAIMDSFPSRRQT